MSSSATESIPREVVILVVIIAAAAVTIVGYVVHRFANPEHFRDDRDYNTPGDQQIAYMREVQRRNLWAMGLDR